MFCHHGKEIPDNATCWEEVPFGHVHCWVHNIKNEPIDHVHIDFDRKAFPVTNRQFVRSGPGYTLSKNVVSDDIEVAVHNSSKKEPAINTSLIVSVIPVVAGLVSALFPKLLSPENWQLLMYIIALLLPIVTGILVRGKVWSPASVRELVQTALTEAENTKK